MNTDSTVGAAILFVATGILCLIGGCSMGYHGAHGDVRSQAIRAGVAYYSVNPTNSAVTFQWKAIPSDGVAITIPPNTGSTIVLPARSGTWTNIVHQ